MLRHHRVLALTTFFVLTSVARGQTVDPTGHWEGSISVPDNPVKVEVDLSKNAKGELAGTFSSSDARGLPLATVALEGKAIRMFLKVSSANSGTFDGVVSDDRKTITGNYNTVEGGYSIPFSLTRTGDARIQAPAKSTAIDKSVEGTWTGTLEVEGTTKHIVLAMSNGPDGTATGTIKSLEQNIEIPIAIVQTGTALSLEIKTIGASYSGTLNAGATEVVGTWKQGPLTLPLTFKHAPR